MLTLVREQQLKKRHSRLRKKISGTPERPRLAVHRSHLNLSVQVVDDLAERTLFSSSTAALKAVQGKKKQYGNIEGSKEFGKFLAGELKKKNINRVVLDRGGWQYHGRIQAFADALRENGIQV